ncbi:MAG TPA: hypothetical protein VF714_11080, partial [Jatrophihabitans sp.]
LLGAGVLGAGVLGVGVLGAGVLIWLAGVLGADALTWPTGRFGFGALPLLDVLIAVTPTATAATTPTMATTKPGASPRECRGPAGWRSASSVVSSGVTALIPSRPVRPGDPHCD